MGLSYSAAVHGLSYSAAAHGLYWPVWAARWIIFNVHWTGCTGCISVGPLLEQEVAVVVAPLLLLVVVVAPLLVLVVAVAPLSLV